MVTAYQGVTRTHTDAEIIESWASAVEYASTPETAAHSLLAWFDAAESWGGVRRYSAHVRAAFIRACAGLIRNMRVCMSDRYDVKRVAEQNRLFARMAVAVHRCSE